MGRYEVVAEASGHVEALIDVAELASAHALRQATADFYLEWQRRRAGPASQQAMATGKLSQVSLQRLGNFDETRRPPRAQRMELDGTEVLLETTMAGNLSLRFDDEPTVAVRYWVEHIACRPDHFSVSCVARTHNRAIERARLVALGRQSQLTVSRDVSVTLRDAQTRAAHGLMEFDLTARLDLADLVGQFPNSDDIVDLAIELEIEGRTETVRFGFRPPPAFDESRLRSGVATEGQRAHLFIPYLTYRSHRLAVRVEHFALEDYRYLQRMLKISWLFPLLKPFARIWLVGEVPYKAQDNGYHFFRWMRRTHPRRRAYFVIDADSPDREKLEPLGNIVEHSTRRHIRYSLLASRLVGSHHSEYLFASRDPRVVRRTRGVRIFLQHGITAGKNVVPIYARQSTFELPTERFAVASELEQRIVMEDYGYPARQVPITGFARFDALFAATERPPRSVLVMPTWREVMRTENFLSSDYYANWHGFLTDPRLQALLNAHQLEITFLLHPNMRMFADYFQVPNVRLVRQGEVDAQKLLTSSAVLITDYSSVAWDFSFLNRPVLFFQFDAGQLIGERAPHIDYWTQLPGPIATTPQRLIALLSEVVDADLTIAPTYRSRAAAFLTYHDQGNCARIYEMITRAWTPRTALDRVRNATWVQRRWWRFRRGDRYFAWMRRLFALGRWLPRKNTVVFECDRGAHFGDAPRYLYERLVERTHGLKIVWANNTTLRLTDPQTRKIKRHSPTYYWELSRARFWVNNQNFPADLVKPTGTRFLQTWHGTPLKRMQHDVPTMLSRDEGYQERAARLTSYWDLLLSGSPYATQCFRSAFQWNGPIAELGYPRNDVFFWPDAAERRELARNRLGLADDSRKIILYAPTFRDDNRPGVNWAHEMELDLDLLARELGDDYVLLVRYHQLVQQAIPTHGLCRPDFVVDVSRYDDVSELLMLADVLVTDYSSVFFDYAALRRPILFFTYDLENYRDQLRGFYLDFESVAPGPLLRTNVELVAALRSLDEVQQRYAAALEHFAVTYGPRDDGSASDRVLDAFFGSAIGPSRRPSGDQPAQLAPVAAQVEGEGGAEGRVRVPTGRHVKL